MKNVFIKFVLLLSFGFKVIIVSAQVNHNTIKELKIGDQCPDFEFTNIINYPKSSVRLSDLKGKLVVLDFWATWCVPCIKSLSELDSLQKQFKSQVVIIAVSREQTAKIKTFLKNSKILGNVQLPFVTQDTSLLYYFRHRLVPHDVWIDENGKVKAITGAEQVTAVNITNMLENKNANIIAKTDIIDRDESRPLLLGGLGKNYTLDNKKLMYSSILTSKVEGLPAALMGIEVYGEQVKLLTYNASISQLYQNAYGNSFKPNTGFNDPDFTLRLNIRTIWEAKDSSLTFNSTLKTPPTFCYELILPKADSLNIKDYAVKDLNRYFGNLYGIEGVKEKRVVKCWVLVKDKGGELVSTKGGKPDISFKDDQNRIIVQNDSISKFLFFWLIYEYADVYTPVLDETNYKRPIDLDITAKDIKDIKSVNMELKKYGLAFQLVDRELDMIVIRDKMGRNK